MPPPDLENPILRELLCEAHALLSRAANHCPRDSVLSSHTYDFVARANILPTRVHGGGENSILRSRLQSAVALVHGYIDAAVAPELHDELARWLRRWSHPEARTIASPPMGSA